LRAGALFSQGKWPEREVNDSLPSKAEVNDDWNYTSATCVAFMESTETLVTL